MYLLGISHIKISYIYRIKIKMPIEMQKINSFQEYEDQYKKSIENPSLFWEEIAQTFKWKKKWNRVLDWDFNKPKVSWFEGGKLNSPPLLVSGGPLKQVRVLNEYQGHQQDIIMLSPQQPKLGTLSSSPGQPSKSQ